MYSSRECGCGELELCTLRVAHRSAPYSWVPAFMDNCRVARGTNTVSYSVAMDLTEAGSILSRVHWARLAAARCLNPADAPGILGPTIS